MRWVKARTVYRKGLCLFDVISAGCVAYKNSPLYPVLALALSEAALALSEAAVESTSAKTIGLISLIRPISPFVFVHVQEMRARKSSNTVQPSGNAAPLSASARYDSTASPVRRITSLTNLVATHHRTFYRIHLPTDYPGLAQLACCLPVGSSTLLYPDVRRKHRFSR